MKKIISFLLVIAISVCIFASCSNGDSNNSPTEKEGITEAKKNTETVTISSRNNQEPLEIIYDDEVVYPGDIYSSEVRFWVSDAILTKHPQSELWKENASRNFSVSFISDISASRKITPDIILAVLKVKSLFTLLISFSPIHIKTQLADILGIIPNIKFITPLSLNSISRNKTVKKKKRTPIIPNMCVIVYFFIFYLLTKNF